MTPDEKIDHLTELVRIARDKHQTLVGRGVDSVARFRAKYAAVERTMKVIDHKVATVGQMVKAKNSVAAEQALDRAIKAAELLNMELDALVALSEPPKSE